MVTTVTNSTITITGQGCLKCDKVRGPSDKVRGPSDKVRGPSDKVRGPSDKVRGPNDKVRGQSDKVRGQSDKVRGPSDKVRGQSDKVRRGPSDKVRGGGVGMGREASYITHKENTNLKYIGPLVCTNWSINICHMLPRVMRFMTSVVFLQ